MGDMETSLQEMVAGSSYSIWRSIKGRKVVIEMMDSVNEHLYWMASILESRRQEATADASKLVDPEVWPPEDAQGWKVAKAILPDVFEDANVHYCSGVVRKRMIMSFIARVNEEKYSTSTLRDQMQALVLATSEILVTKLADECYPRLVDTYEETLRQRR